MSTLVTILHVLVCIFLMLTVLLQAGKGGGMGAAFGGGSSSGTVFGGAGAGNFLRRLTVGAAVVFMLTSMTLAYLASSTGADSLKSYELTQKKEANAKRKEHERILSGDAGVGEAGDEAAAGGDDLDGAELLNEIDPEAAKEMGLDELGEMDSADQTEGDDSAAEDAAEGDSDEGEGQGDGTPPAADTATDDAPTPAAGSDSADPAAGDTPPAP